MKHVVFNLNQTPDKDYWLSYLKLKIRNNWNVNLRVTYTLRRHLLDPEWTNRERRNQKHSQRMRHYHPRTKICGQWVNLPPLCELDQKPKGSCGRYEVDSVEKPLLEIYRQVTYTKQNPSRKRWYILLTDLRSSQETESFGIYIQGLSVTSKKWRREEDGKNQKETDYEYHYDT